MTIQSLASQCCHYTLNAFMNVLKSVQNVLQMLFFTFQFLYLGIVTYGVSTAIESGMYNMFVAYLKNRLICIVLFCIVHDS